LRSADDSLSNPTLPFLPSQLTGSAQDFKSATRRVVRALVESRIRGVKTNIPFLLNVLNHEDFLKGTATTRFIEEHPELMIIPSRRNRANRVSQPRTRLNHFPEALRKVIFHLTFVSPDASFSTTWAT
jgi:pyruvate carboxylase